MERVEIKSDLLRWAVHHSGRKTEDLVERFPKLNDWEAGAAYPTLKQLEDFAAATKTPIGYFFLIRPPEEKVPIPDYRKIINARDVCPVQTYLRPFISVSSGRSGTGILLDPQVSSRFHLSAKSV